MELQGEAHKRIPFWSYLNTEFLRQQYNGDDALWINEGSINEQPKLDWEIYWLLCLFLERVFKNNMPFDLQGCMGFLTNNFLCLVHWELQIIEPLMALPAWFQTLFVSLPGDQAVTLHAAQ